MFCPHRKIPPIQVHVQLLTCPDAGQRLPLPDRVLLLSWAERPQGKTHWALGSLLELRQDYATCSVRCIADDKHGALQVEVG